MLNKNCSKCGSPFLVKAYRKDTAKFCSRTCCDAARIGRAPTNKGVPCSEERKKKISEAHKGKKLSDDTKRKLALASSGRKHSEKTRKLISEAQKGEKGPGWKGGITPVNVCIRQSAAYASWRMAVFHRDAFTCQSCGTTTSPFNAHHIKSFSAFPELRFEVSNGQTLCVPCHEKTPTYLKKKKEILWP